MGKEFLADDTYVYDQEMVPILFGLQKGVRAKEDLVQFLKRTAACLNVCDGMTGEWLELGAGVWRKSLEHDEKRNAEFADLMRKNHRLLEELEKTKAQSAEMLKLLEDISCPRRGTEAETWNIEPRVVQLAARLVDEVSFERAIAEAE